ncbi:hypothetical protein AB0N07_24975 [Streptomyces sp. NPDC051172]|uniref:hypothetical protein n=1 Tax=Streptomyces sp. NPDC051172 TaxID=3155796 RepID=UPI003440757E
MTPATATTVQAPLLIAPSSLRLPWRTHAPVAHEGAGGLLFRIGEGPGTDVDQHTAEGAAREVEGRIVVGEDGLAALAAHAQALAVVGEHAGRGPDPDRPHLAVVDVQGQGCDREAVVLGVVGAEGGRQDVVADGHPAGCGALLLHPAQPPVDVVLPCVEEIQAVPAEPAAPREQHAAGLRAVEADVGGEGAGPAADVDRHRLGHVGAVGVVHVLASGFGELRSWRAEDLDRRAVVERQPVAAFGLGAVLPQVVQLPGVVAEAAPAGRCRRMQRRGVPAAVPDAAGARHDVEPRVPGVGCLGALQDAAGL